VATAHSSGPVAPGLVDGRLPGLGRRATHELSPSVRYLTAVPLRMEATTASRAARGWNPVRVIQATVALLPVAIAVGGASTAVVLPVAVICVFGVVRREKLISAPTEAQRRAIERMARVPKVAQAAVAGYTLVGFAAIYALFSGSQRMVALVAQTLIVFAGSIWVRSIFNRDETHPGGGEPRSDPATAGSQPPPGFD
jgi:hypothetical protein